MINDIPLIPQPAKFLGQLIATRRRELRRSQQDLADDICVVSGRATLTRHEISRYERERRIPTSASLAKLADVLQLPPSQLREAANLTAWRRRLAAHAGDSLDPIPGYLIHPGHDTPLPMLLIGTSV